MGEKFYNDESSGQQVVGRGVGAGTVLRGPVRKRALEKKPALGSETLL